VRPKKRYVTEGKWEKGGKKGGGKYQISMNLFLGRVVGTTKWNVSPQQPGGGQGGPSAIKRCGGGKRESPLQWRELQPGSVCDVGPCGGRLPIQRSEKRPERHGRKERSERGEGKEKNFKEGVYADWGVQVIDRVQERSLKGERVLEGGQNRLC